MEKSIKTLVFLFSLLFSYTIVLAEVKVPSEIKFNKEVYKQVYQAGNGKTSDKVTEYLKSGETLEKFEKMFSIWEYPNAKDVKIFTGNLIRNSNTSYKITPREILENDDNTETMASLIITAGNVSEYNIYRVLIKDGHVVTYQFSYRIYDNPGTPAYKKWLESLDKNETEWFKAMVNMKDIK